MKGIGKRIICDILVSVSAGSIAGQRQYIKHVHALTVRSIVVRDLRWISLYLLSRHVQSLEKKINPSQFQLTLLNVM